MGHRFNEPTVSHTMIAERACLIDEKSNTVQSCKWMVNSGRFRCELERSLSKTRTDDPTPRQCMWSTGGSPCMQIPFSHWLIQKTVLFGACFKHRLEWATHSPVSIWLPDSFVYTNSNVKKTTTREHTKDTGSCGLAELRRFLWHLTIDTRNAYAYDIISDSCTKRQQ